MSCLSDVVRANTDRYKFLLLIEPDIEKTSADLKTDEIEAEKIDNPGVFNS